MNLYDGCESNKEIIYGFTSLDFYNKLQVFIQVQELLYILIKFPK